MVKSYKAGGLTALQSWTNSFVKTKSFNNNDFVRCEKRKSHAKSVSPPDLINWNDFYGCAWFMKIGLILLRENFPAAISSFWEWEWFGFTLKVSSPLPLHSNDFGGFYLSPCIGRKSRILLADIPNTAFQLELQLPSEKKRKKTVMLTGIAITTTKKRN